MFIQFKKETYKCSQVKVVSNISKELTISELYNFILSFGIEQKANLVTYRFKKKDN